MTALMGLSARIRTSKLWLITDLRREQGDFRDVVVAALRGGVDVVELRDAQASQQQLLDGLELARQAANQVNATVVVGRDPELARRAQADALHLGAADGDIATGRRSVHEHALVGRSAHCPEQLSDTGADFLLVGPVFGDEPSLPGLDLVREAARVQPVDQLDAVPWFAVGGITRDTLPQVLAAGALRVAVSAAITGAADPQAEAQALKATLQQAWDARPEMERYAIRSLGGGNLRFATAPFEPGTGGPVEPGTGGPVEP